MENKKRFIPLKEAEKIRIGQAIYMDSEGRLYVVEGSTSRQPIANRYISKVQVSNGKATR